MPAPEDVLRELNDSSVALLAALRNRSPLFLEHLERRERALLALKTRPVTLQDLPLLQAAVITGQAAALEAQQMRNESVRALNRVQLQRSFSRGLADGADYPTAALDIKA